MFGKAKRFNYKPIEDNPSPADYSLTSRLDKGIKFAKGSRFSYSTDRESDSFKMCSRMLKELPSSTPKSECSETEPKQLKRKIIKFNTDDIRRQSIRRKSSNRNTKFNTSTTDSGEYLYDSGACIDDDYHSLTSSEELYKLRKTEKKCNFKEACKETRGSKEKYAGRNHQKNRNFEEIVLEKLINIENNIDNLNEKMDNKEKQTVDVVITPGEPRTERCLPDKLKLKILETITQNYKNLTENLEEERKAKVNEVQEKISWLLVEISETSEEREIKKTCQSAAKQLSKDISMLLDNNLVNQHVPTIEVAEDIASEKIFKYCENTCEILTAEENLKYNDILEQTELEIIKLKCKNSQHLLEFEESLIETIKDLLKDLTLS